MSPGQRLHGDGHVGWVREQTRERLEGMLHGAVLTKLLSFLRVTLANHCLHEHPCEVK